MVRAAALILMLFAANAAASAPAMTAGEITKSAARLAYTAKVMGACEQYLSREDAIRNIRVITGGDEALDEKSAQLIGLYARYYAIGRSEAREWSSTQCLAELEAAKRPGPAK